MAVRSILLGGACGAAMLAAASAAQASEPFDYAFTPVSPLIYDWSGVYAGAAVGGIWSDFDTMYAPSGPFSFGAQGYTFSGVSGVLAQVNSFVFGVEVELNLSSLDETRVVAGIPVTAESPWTSGVRGRAGYAFDRYLVYGTGGIAAGRFRLSAPGMSASSTEFGWTLGAGIEMGLTENFTARAEYLYSDYGSASGTLGASPFSTEFDAHTVRAGVTYRFR